METVLAILVGSLFAGGVYLLMRRSIVKLIIGLVLLSHSVNLMIFIVGGLTRGEPPLVPEGLEQPLTTVADPLPQALILTAIVISFAVLAFALVLFHRVYQTMGTDDLDTIKSAHL